MKSVYFKLITVNNPWFRISTKFQTTLLVTHDIVTEDSLRFHYNVILNGG